METVPKYFFFIIETYNHVITQYVIALCGIMWTRGGSIIVEFLGNPHPRIYTHQQIYILDKQDYVFPSENKSMHLRNDFPLKKQQNLQSIKMAPRK